MSLSSKIRNAAQVLPAIEHPSFSTFFDTFGKSRVVLIGDGSHGTSEFYRARAAITKRLVEKHGFSIVAIEADWPDAKAIDRVVRQLPASKLSGELGVFQHFPMWMWRNTEVQEFINWLRDHNRRLSPGNRTALAGLDLYSMGNSIRHVIDYLEKVDPDLAKLAKKRYACLEPWEDDPVFYGRDAWMKGTAPCEKGVLAMLKDLLRNRLELEAQDGDDFFNAEMNARLIRDAEEYYRTMFYGSAESWNQRDRHFFRTLMSLMADQEDSKVVVWAHNSHCGDARYTDMGQTRHELTLGQLCKEQFGDECVIIGCGTHTGTVAAAREWDEPVEIMHVNPSISDSYEYLMHETGIPAFMLDFRKGKMDEERLGRLL